MPIKLKDVLKAKTQIQDLVHATELDTSRSCAELLGCKTYLKLENQQLTGSFKIRGATNKIFSLSEAEKKKGVVASSAGNHAQGVALAAAKQNVKAKIIMPITAPLVKVQATRNYGAEVLLYGDYYDEAYQKALDIEKEQGLVFVHPFEDPKVIAGQGTLALEVLDKVPDLDSIVVPVGGGGLISGIATVAKELNPKIKIFGVQAEGAKSMTESFHANKLVDVGHSISTIADGVAVRHPSKFMYENYIARLVDDMVTVNEDEIAESIVFMMERAKQVVEGAGALSLAGARKLKNKIGSKTCLIVCGGNIDLNIVAKVIERGLKKEGRLTTIRLAVEDKPGVLSELTSMAADTGANIIQVDHDRTSEGLYLGEAALRFLLETKDWEQIDALSKSMSTVGRLL